MKILAFSDLHRDRDQAARLTDMSADADVVIGAGDFASVHKGLGKTIRALSGIKTPTVLVPGNNETEEDLRAATAEWPAARVLHGEATEIGGVTFFGLGGGIPVTPWDWSFDLEENEAATKLEACPQDGVLVIHSPPNGFCDLSGAGKHLGSQAIVDAIASRKLELTVCGHIHESWGERATIGSTQIANLGPTGSWFEV